MIINPGGREPRQPDPARADRQRPVSLHRAGGRRAGRRDRSIRRGERPGRPDDHRRQLRRARRTGAAIRRRQSHGQRTRHAAALDVSSRTSNGRRCQPYNPDGLALTLGTRLGPYEILSALGAGGMGEVYRARDTKLGRDVALKVLPDSFANDTDRLARFEREAKALASLNHPHIAQIYGFEHSGSRPALVMELVEGPDLSQRIAQRSDPACRSPVDRATDRLGPRVGARARDRSPRPETREHQGRRRRNGESAGLRAGEGGASDRRTCRGSDGLADDQRARDGGRRHSRHGRVHESRAGEGPPGG